MRLCKSSLTLLRAEVEFGLNWSYNSTERSNNSQSLGILLLQINQYNRETSNATCVWYGVCKVTPIKHKLYCSYNGTAKALDGEGQKLLAEFCPHLLGGQDNTYTCCDNEQVSPFECCANCCANCRRNWKHYTNLMWYVRRINWLTVHLPYFRTVFVTIYHARTHALYLTDMDFAGAICFKANRNPYNIHQPVIKSRCCSIACHEVSYTSLLFWETFT